MKHTPPSLIVTDPRCMSSALNGSSVMSLIKHQVFAESRHALAAAATQAEDNTLVTAHDYW